MTHLLRRSSVRTVSATVVAVAASLLLPFLVHLLPAWNGTSIGAVFLPIFYAPFLAAIFLGPVPGLGAAALTPLVNHLVTGMPVPPILAVLTVELIVFVALVLLSRKKFSGNPLIAPLAYLGARAITFMLLMPFDIGAQSLSALMASLKVTLPGITILLLLNFVVARIRQNRRSA